VSPTTKTSAKHRRERKARGNARVLVKVAEATQVLAHHHSAQQAQMTWDSPIGNTNWGKGAGKGKGKGKGQAHQNQGKGKGFTGYANTQWHPGKQRQDGNWQKQLQDMERRIQARDKQMQDLAKKLAATNVSATASKQGSPKPTTPMATAKPMMPDSKGQLREITWTCKGCNQPHWSQKATTCVCCKQDKTTTGVWTTAATSKAREPASQVSADQRKRLKPFNSNKILSSFQKLQLLTEEDLATEDDVMDVEDGSGEALQLAREAELSTLKFLKDAKASEKVIKEQQAIVDALPQPKEPKASQGLWDNATFRRIQAQLADNYQKEKVGQDNVLQDMQRSLEKAQALVTAQEVLIAEQEVNYRKYNTACMQAIAKTQNASETAVPGDAPPSHASNTTATQYTASVLARQLAKAEQDPWLKEKGIDLDTLKYLYSLTLMGAMADEAEAASPAQETTEANVVA
jgi:hypothetical protein